MSYSKTIDKCVVSLMFIPFEFHIATTIPLKMNTNNLIKYTTGLSTCTPIKLQHFLKRYNTPKICH